MTDFWTGFMVVGLISTPCILGFVAFFVIERRMNRRK